MLIDPDEAILDEYDEAVENLRLAELTGINIFPREVILRKVRRALIEQLKGEQHCDGCTCK